MKKNLWAIVKAPIVPLPGIQTRASTSTFGTLVTTQDEQALGIIVTALHDNYFHFIDECTTAYNTWITLEKNFGARSKKSKVILKRQLQKIKLEENEDIVSLVNHLKSIITQLIYIQCEVEEEDKVVALLSTLPDTYDHLITILEEKRTSSTCTSRCHKFIVRRRKEAQEGTCNKRRSVFR